MAYLAADSFNGVLNHLVKVFPAICRRVPLHYQSVDGRNIQGIRIGKPGTSTKRTVLLFAGCHARELVNPDLLLMFASELMNAYDTNSDLHFGSVVYGKTAVRLIVDAIDIIIVPLINPDGRAFVQSSPANAMWRKNRRPPNPGSTCFGVDINRNYDFLWSSGIGTSANQCSLTYKGPAPFSEPETLNVKWLLDTYPEIAAMVDVHSFSELVLHPWGDDETQTTDPSMNFMNSAFDGMRGNGGDTYKEYMDPDDRALFIDVGYRVRDAIHAVRGHCYTVEPGFALYPTSGTSKDYAYSRHLVDPTQRKVYAYTFETGREFQPLPPEAAQVMTEVSAGLFQFCLAMCCAILSNNRHNPSCALTVSTIDLLREPKLMRTKTGRLYEKLLTTHFMEIRELMDTNQTVYRSIVRLVRSTDKIALLHFANPPGVIDAPLVRNLEQALTSLSQARGVGEKLKKTADSVCKDLHHFKGKTFLDGLKSASLNQRPKSRAKK